MQAINTYCLPPTDTHGMRIKAKCFKLARIYPYQHELNHDENQVYAAEKLAQELGWWEGLVWVAGELHDGSWAHVAHSQKAR